MVTFEQDGVTYVLLDGDIYRPLPGGELEFVDHLYDPDFYATNYRTISGRLYQVDPDSGQPYPVVRSFADGFERAASVSALITPARWHTNNTDPSNAGSPDNYYDLGNRITLVSSPRHGGVKALRCYAVPSADRVSKASLARGILYFVKGDELAFSGWFYVEPTPSLYDGGGTTLLDLESSFMKYVGLRLVVRQPDALAVELELPKTQFRQPAGSEVAFPQGRWVRIDGRVRLSDENGRVRLWQDARLILDQTGRTLPFADTVFDRLEVGVTGLAQGAQYEKGLIVDDVRIRTV